LVEVESTTRINYEGETPTLEKVDFEEPEMVWDDDEMRAFYEELPDLTKTVPLQYLGSRYRKMMKEKAQKKSEDEDEKQQKSPKKDESKEPSSPKQEQGKEKSKKTDSTKTDGKKPGDVEEKGGDEDGKEKEPKGKVAKLQDFLQKLSTCINKDLIDEAAGEERLNLSFLIPP